MNTYVGDTAALNDPKYFKKSYNYMDDARKAKIDRLRFKKDKILSLGAGMIIQFALFIEGHEGAEIATTPSGKPYVKDVDNLFINVSHSGTKVLCVSGEYPVGCDIEQIGEPSMAVAKRTFSRRELENTIFMDDREFKDYYFKIWTAKESYLKMTGEGLTRPLNELSIHVPFANQSVEKGKERATFFDIDCGEGYQGTICVQNACQGVPIYRYKYML